MQIHTLLLPPPVAEDLGDNKRLTQKFASLMSNMRQQVCSIIFIQYFE